MVLLQEKRRLFCNKEVFSDAQATKDGVGQPGFA
jgi:hypothetical protein